MAKLFPKFIFAACLFLTMFFLTYAAGWVAWHNMPLWWDEQASPTSQYIQINALDSEIRNYAAKHGEFPNSLEELAEDLPKDNDVRGRIEFGSIIDIWNHPIQYEKAADGYHLYSLGRDGKPGGEGVDADLEIKPHTVQCMPPTFHQFFFEMKWSPVLLIAAILSGSFAIFTCLCTAVPRQLKKKPNKPLPQVKFTEVCMTVSLTLIFCIGIGLVITIIHSCTGH
jgi:hypothetical protein